MESFERELFKRRKLKTSKNEFINESIGFVLFANELLTFEILSNESIKQYVCCAYEMKYYMPLKLLVHCAKKLEYFNLFNSF